MAGVIDTSCLWHTHTRSDCMRLFVWLWCNTVNCVLPKTNRYDQMMQGNCVERGREREKQERVERREQQKNSINSQRTHRHFAWAMKLVLSFTRVWLFFPLESRIGLSLCVVCKSWWCKLNYSMVIKKWIETFFSLLFCFPLTH